MSNIPKLLKSGLARLLLATSLGLAVHGSANADLVTMPAPDRFHVQIDSSTLSGNGWMAFTLLAGGSPASGVQVQIENFAGAWLAGSERDGDVQGDFPQFQLGNTDFYNELRQQVSWGGLLDFDLHFSGDYASVAGDIGSTLGIALLSEDLTAYAGDFTGNVLEFAITPVQADGPATLTVSNLAPSVATSFAVPEPDAASLVVLGLLLLALCQQRRRAQVPGNSRLQRP